MSCVEGEEGKEKVSAQGAVSVNEERRNACAPTSLDELRKDTSKSLQGFQRSMEYMRREILDEMFDHLFTCPSIASAHLRAHT